MNDKSFVTSTNPGRNYEILGKIEASSEQEIIDKVSKARSALAGWNSLGVDGRVALLRNVVEAFKKRKEEAAQLMAKEMGMPISDGRMEVDAAMDYFSWYLDNASKCLSPEVSYEDDTSIHKVFFEPIGVAAVITPWNFPLSNFVWGVCQNLVVGNTVVFKHSKEVQLCGKLIEEIVSECKLPEGVFNEIYGNSTAADFLIHQDINLICFTGSTKVGRHIYQVAAEKLIKAVLELGGSAPGIVFEDADVDAILDSIYYGKFTNCGQVCDGLKRLIVHESRFDEVVEKMKLLLESKKVGVPDDEEASFGPLVAKRQVDLLEEQVKDAVSKGAKVVTGGKRPEGLQGAYYRPTILTDVTKDMRVWNEEVFGPVLPVVSFKTEEEALELANDTRYGLGSYLYCRDKERTSRVTAALQAGMVSVNNAFYLVPASPFGGYKESGLGREHGKYGLQELTQIKVVAFEK